MTEPTVQTPAQRIQRALQTAIDAKQFDLAFGILIGAATALPPELPEHKRANADLLKQIALRQAHAVSGSMEIYMDLMGLTKEMFKDAQSH